MIVRMRHLDLVCLASEKEATLERLRALGFVHLDLASSAGAPVAEAAGEIANAEKAVRLILKARGKEECNVHERTVGEILALDRDRETLKAERERLEREIRTYEPYGDFDPELVRALTSRGIDLASVAELPAKLPEMRLSRMQEKLSRVVNRLEIDEAKIAGCDEKALLRRFPVLRDRLAFEQARGLLADHGAVAVLSGWIPATCEKKLMLEVTHAGVTGLFERTHGLGWGVLLRDAESGEVPPTLIEPPRFFHPVKVLFEGLGVAPAYTEADVSVPFMCYFSLFFAMLVGDGAYGAIFLAAALFFRRKLPRSWFILLTVFSAATVVWGVLSNTWFGAALPILSSLPTAKWLKEYNHMMLLCFTIGVSHLMLARLWNGICRLPDTTALAEFGWAGVLMMMYLVTNAIVGIFPAFPSWGYWVGGVSVAAVFLFSVKPSELKTRGAELGMLPLSIMSALGDIISYVRLFAVGLASVKVAKNFNDMAIDLVRGEADWYVKGALALAMVAILVFGHVLNLMMAGLSILVHAVRLNTLEFSNHKGITWSGVAFRAFARVAGR